MSADLPAPVVVLSRALDQAEAMLGRVRSEHLSLPTPCRDWSVGRLASHLVADPGNFATTMKGGQPDWSAAPEPVGDDPARAFRRAADELLRSWQEQDGSAAAVADWQTAEIAVHTWDLARALARPTSDLDAEAAERGLAFMRANLTADNRGQAFGPERAAPPGAPAPDRLAAFAGREV